MENKMASENIPEPDTDKRELQNSPHSHPSAIKESESSFRSTKREKYQEDMGSPAGDRARTRTREPEIDPDRDQCSNGERSSISFYSDDYENNSPSERSLSPRSPSPSPRRPGHSRRVSSSPLQRGGVQKGRRPRRPGAHPHHRPPSPPQRRTGGPRIHSRDRYKDSAVPTPPRDVDPVTRRLLSARLLKIGELQNALAELRQNADELRRENRLLRQLQLRQERELQRQGDTEGEIAQLLANHGNETAALRERLRRAQEGQRTAEKGLRRADAQLQHCRAQLQKLRRLADDQQLGEREELSHRLESATQRAQEAERRVKELERNMELSSGSFQRQLASERRRTQDAQAEVQSLQEEVERLGAKLKEKERELDARNIYANRMLKTSSKRESERKTSPSKNSSKAVQTVEPMRSLEFPSPPPAITDGNGPALEDSTDDYLSLKVHRPSKKLNHKVKKQELDGEGQKPKGAEEWKEPQRERENEKEPEQGREKQDDKEREKFREREEKERTDREHNLLEEKAKRQRDEREREEEDRKRREQAREEERMGAANQERAEVERQRKEQLLAKMCEIDRQAQSGDGLETGLGVGSPPRYPEPRNQSASIFSFTEPAESISSRLGSGGGRRGGILRTQRVSQDADLAFGSYTPSFGQAAPRAGVPSRTPNPDPEPPSDEDAGLDLSGMVKERKAALMQQLFGSSAAPLSPPSNATRKMEILSPPPQTKGSRRREMATPPGQNGAGLASNRSTLQVSESRPAVRAIPTFDDDIEELAL